MQSGEEQAQLARALLAGAFQGVLSTHSLEHEGYPFGSVVPYTLDQTGAPIMLLSHLSQHTKNLDANPRCGLTLSAPGSGDVQQRARLSAIGAVSSIESSADTESYFAYFPHTRVYHDELGFRFYRLQPVRFHWNGGFATARWFDPSRIVHEKPFSLEITKQILGHMNRDHADALLHYIRHSIDHRPDGPATMIGIDGEGMDLRVGDHLYRAVFPRRVTSPEEVRAVLVEMAARGD